MLQHQPSSLLFLLLLVISPFATAFRLTSSSTMHRSLLRVSTRTIPSSSIHRLRQKIVRTVVSSTKNDNDNSIPPLFSFGLISDIQYVDADDATNFAGTTQRFYRHSFNTYKEALKYWQNEVKPLPKCALVLGDILDGKTAQMRYVIPLYIHLTANLFPLLLPYSLMTISNIINALPLPLLPVGTKKNVLDVFWMHQKTCRIRFIIASVSSPSNSL